MEQPKNISEYTEAIVFAELTSHMEISPLAQHLETFDAGHQALLHQMDAVMIGEGGSSKNRATETLRSLQASHAVNLGNYATATLRERDNPLDAVNEIALTYLNAEQEIITRQYQLNPAGAYSQSDGHEAIIDFIAGHEPQEAGELLAMLDNSILRDNISACITTAPLNKNELSSLAERVTEPDPAPHKVRNIALRALAKIATLRRK